MARAEGTLEGEGATTSPAIHPFVRPPTGDDIRDPLSNAEPCPTPPPFSWSRHLHQYVKAQRAMTSVGQLCLRCLETVELHLAVAWRGVPTHASKLAGPLHRGVAARRAVLPLQQTSCSSHPPSLRLVFLGWLLFFHHSRTHTHSHALIRTSRTSHTRHLSLVDLHRAARAPIASLSHHPRSSVSSSPPRALRFSPLLALFPCVGLSLAATRCRYTQAHTRTHIIATRFIGENKEKQPL